jgi:DNA-binding GntR family transcriptional regulator
MLDVDALPQPVFTDPRGVSLTLHDHLRRLIVDNALPAGTILKQAQLARTFGVSRTPMREAFRMLQEEGLIAAETNQRARVRELDVDELDSLYGVRVSLEALGARLTAGRLTEAEAADADKALGDMEVARQRDDHDAWVHAHRRFHLTCVARAGEPLRRLIASHSERSERYVRLHQTLHPQSFIEAHVEHAGILAAVVEGDSYAAGARMARHLSRTSLTVLSDMDPDAPGLATRTALATAEARPA